HLILKNASAGDGKAAGTAQSGEVDEDGGGVGIVEINKGRVAVAGGCDGGVVGAAPGADGAQSEPISGIAAAFVSNKQIGLDRFCGRDAAALFNAAVDEVG